MSGIVIGNSGGHNVSIDRKVMMSTRLLIIADSGGGKTWLLKRLIEQSFGQVGIIIIDPEGEFAPLRTKYDFFLVGKGGDTPADIRTAEKVAHTLLAGRASAVCDIYDMQATERHIWVQRFLGALLDAPKELRHPYFVIVDEAHMFCPEHGKGESVASDAMRGLAGRGRKRLLCGMFASQRAALLSKDLTGMCLNRLVGPTFESVNQKRAVEELGIPKGKDEGEFRAKIKMLEPGYFYALGRAITKELKLVHVGPIETPHGQEALKYELKPPPPTEKVREWLAQLGDLPKQAEEEARTVADFKKQIRELRAQLRAAPAKIETKEIRVADPRAIERAVRDASHGYQKTIASLQQAFKRQAQLLADIAMRAAKAANVEIPKIELPKIAIPSQHAVSAGPRAERVDETAQVRRAQPRVIPAESNGDGELSRPQQAIIRSIAEFEAIGRAQISKPWIAARSGASYTSSSYGNNLGALRSSGYIAYPGPDLVALTDKGRAAAGAVEAPSSSEEMLDSCLRLLSSSQQKILRALHDAYPQAMKKNELAEIVGASAASSTYGNNLGALRSAGMIEYPEPGTAKAADWLFLDK